MFPLAIKVGLVCFAVASLFFLLRNDDYVEPESRHWGRPFMQETERDPEVEETGNFEVERRRNSEDHQCAICLENIKNYFELDTLRCRHKFHKECLKIWFETQGSWWTCPCCRRNVNR